jgi:hypothetical protein
MRRKQGMANEKRAHAEARQKMTSSSDLTNSPIFIVGSFPSGTSILSWCLGQHPNILMQEESNWIGPFAVDVGMAYELGTLRGELAQLSAMNVQREEFFAIFGSSINKLILNHRRDLELKRLRDHRSSRAATVPRGDAGRPLQRRTQKRVGSMARPNILFTFAACGNYFPKRGLFTLCGMSPRSCALCLIFFLTAATGWSPTSRRLTTIGFAG